MNPSIALVFISTHCALASVPMMFVDLSPVPLGLMLDRLISIIQSPLVGSLVSIGLAFPDARWLFQWLFDSATFILLNAFLTLFVLMMLRFRRIRSHQETAKNHNDRKADSEKLSVTESDISFWKYLDPLLIRFAFGIAIMIVLFAIGRFLFPVITSQSVNPPISMPEAERQIGEILTTTQNILNLVAVVLTLATIGGAIFGYMLRRDVEVKIARIEDRLEKTISEAEKVISIAQKGMHDELEAVKRELHGAIDRFDANLTASHSNILLTADLSLINLPDFTYTQQIPVKILHDLRILEGTFSSPSGRSLWERLVTENNADRIRYAMGLYYLGMYATKPKRIASIEVANKNQFTTSAINHLANAFEKADSDLLKRNILIRWFQAYRQISDNDGAGTVLKKLGELDEGRNYDPQANVLSRWGAALLALQQGLDESVVEIEERRKFFAAAANKMMGIFGEVFGWGIEAPKCLPSRWHYSSRRNSNLAYYTAKSMWAFRFTYGIGKSGFPDEAEDYIGIDCQKFYTRLVESLDVALCLFDYERNQYIPDPFIAAIYNYCVALVLTVRMFLDDPGLNTPFHAQFIDKEFWESYRERNLKAIYLNRDLKAWEEYRKDCLDTAKRLYNALRVMRNSESGLHVPDVIYVESIERLGDLSDFDEDIKLLDAAIRDPNVIFEFYGKGKRPA